MAWTTPKTDWYGVTNPSDGVYTGDRFNAVDFNRIQFTGEMFSEVIDRPQTTNDLAQFIFGQGCVPRNDDSSVNAGDLHLRVRVDACLLQ